MCFRVPGLLIQRPPVDFLKFQRKWLHGLFTFILHILFVYRISILSDHGGRDGKADSCAAVVELSPEDIAVGR